MVVKELKKILSGLPDDMEIRISGDAEGNDFHGLYEAQVEDGFVYLWPDDEYIEL